MTLRLSACLLAAVLVTACGDPPNKEMDQAQGAIDAARAAGADHYAATEYTAATDALKRSQDAVGQRDYRQALNEALDSREHAQNAAREAADTKAQVRFRTHSGSILTDFAEDALKTTSENLSPESWGTMAGQHAAIATKVAMEVGREMSQMAREIAEETRAAVQEAQAVAQAAREPKESRDLSSPTPPRPPRAPHKPTIPAISGGRVVSGSLNGGGAPLQITSMSGDITFRKK